MGYRSSWQKLLAVGVVVVAACDDSTNGETKQPFSPSPGSVQIGSTGIYLVDGQPAAKPTTTTGDSVPKIVKVTAAQTGEHTFTLTMDVEGDREIAFAYLDFVGHGVFKAPVRALVAAVDPNASYAEGCRQALASQNIACTDACIAACDCVTCSDATATKNLKQGCAVSCSASVDSKAIASTPYNGSEKVFADVVYNGLPDRGLQGSAAQAGCNAKQCAAAGQAATAKKLQQWSVKFEAPTVPELTPLVAPQVQADDGVITSAPFGAASVSMCKQGQAVPCR